MKITLIMQVMSYKISSFVSLFFGFFLYLFFIPVNLEMSCNFNNGTCCFMKTTLIMQVMSYKISSFVSLFFVFFLYLFFIPVNLEMSCNFNNGTCCFLLWKKSKQGNFLQDTFPFYFVISSVSWL